MKELIIYEYQAKHIEDTFRRIANILESHDKKSCVDRDIMQGWEMIKNIIAKEPNKQVKR